MKKSLIRLRMLHAVAFTMLLISCKKNVQEPLLENNSVDATSISRAGRTSLPVVSLRVKIFDADPLGNAYNITSDGKGDYVDGVDYVSAVLDQYGTFAFNTLGSGKPKTVVVRWVNYNFNKPVDPANTYRPTSSTNYNYHFSTGGSPFGTNPVIPIQNLGINGNPSTECIYMGNGLTDGTNAWRVSFHKGIEDTQDSPTAFAVVTRKTINPAVWTIGPSGPCSPNSNVASLRDNATSFLYGYYYLPFYFELTAQ